MKPIITFFVSTLLSLQTWCQTIENFNDKLRLKDSIFSIGREILDEPETTLTHRLQLSPRQIDSIFDVHQKVVVFWSVKDPESVKDLINHINSLDTYRTNNILLIPICIDRDKDAWKKFISNMKLDYNYIYDYESDRFKKYGDSPRLNKFLRIAEAVTLPFSMFLDQDNRVFVYNCKNGCN